MRKLSLGKMLAVVLLSSILMTPSYAGVWEVQCAGCHNGQLAPSKNQLKAKFKNPKKFVEAAQKTSSPMMNAFKNNKKVLENAAKEIFGK